MSTRLMKQMRQIALLIVAFCFLGAPIKADLPVKKVLTLEAAKKIAAAAEAEAKKRRATVVIVVVDDGGHLCCSSVWMIRRSPALKLESAKHGQQRFSVGRAKYLKIRYARVASQRSPCLVRRHCKAAFRLFWTAK